MLLTAFLIGFVCGLRSMTAPAAVAWGAHLGWLSLRGLLATVFASRITLVVFSVFALGEWIADKLPFIPARTQLGPLGVRIVFGAVCGAALFPSQLLVGAATGAVGGIAGTFAGYHYRRGLSSLSPDWVLAVLEDLVAIGGGLFAVSRFR